MTSTKGVPGLWVAAIVHEPMLLRQCLIACVSRSWKILATATAFGLQMAVPRT